MSLFVDTSVWSLALRRDAWRSEPEVSALRDALLGADQLFMTGLVLQELLQGFSGPEVRDRLVERFAALAFLVPAKSTLTPPMSETPAAVAASRSEPCTRCSSNSVAAMIWSCCPLTTTFKLRPSLSSSGYGLRSDGL